MSIRSRRVYELLIQVSCDITTYRERKLITKMDTNQVKERMSMEKNEKKFVTNSFFPFLYSNMLHLDVFFFDYGQLNTIEYIL